MLPFSIRAGRMFGKGDFRYIVLEALRERPMHGYEIMKVVAERFSGVYTPSAGVVYPTLQMLEDLGYVKCVSEEGKKIYEMTREGRRFLRSNKDVVKASLRRHEEFFCEERVRLFSELRKLARLLFTSFGDLTPEKAERVAEIVEEARRKISNIIQG